MKALSPNLWTARQFPVLYSIFEGEFVYTLDPISPSSISIVFSINCFYIVGLFHFVLYDFCMSFSFFLVTFILFLVLLNVAFISIMLFFSSFFPEFCQLDFHFLLLLFNLFFEPLFFFFELIFFKEGSRFLWLSLRLWRIIYLNSSCVSLRSSCVTCSLFTFFFLQIFFLRIVCKDSVLIVFWLLFMLQ